MPKLNNYIKQTMKNQRNWELKTETHSYHDGRDAWVTTNYIFQPVVSSSSSVIKKLYMNDHYTKITLELPNNQHHVLEICCSDDSNICDSNIYCSDDSNYFHIFQWIRQLETTMTALDLTQLARALSINDTRLHRIISQMDDDIMCDTYPWISQDTDEEITFKNCQSKITFEIKTCKEKWSQKPYTLLTLQLPLPTLFRQYRMPTNSSCCKAGVDGTFEQIEFNLNTVDLYSVVRWIREIDVPISDAMFYKFVIQVFDAVQQPLSQIFLDNVDLEMLNDIISEVGERHSSKLLDNASDFVKFHVELSKDKSDPALLFKYAFRANLPEAEHFYNELYNRPFGTRFDAVEELLRFK